MEQLLKRIKSVLDKVLPNKVFYGNNIADNGDNASKPYIVYQLLSSRTGKYADDKSMFRIATIQINLVTERKDLVLEEKLESTLDSNFFNYEMISELVNDDSSINRVYEIKKEVLKHE